MARLPQKTILLVLISSLLIGMTLGCSATIQSTAFGDNPPTSQSQPLPPSDTPIAEDSSLSPNLANRILMTVQEEQQPLNPNIQIVEATHKTWPDGCLGISKAEEVCTQALVEGWLVTVSNGEDTWLYRTDSIGTQIRFDPNTP